MNQDLTSLSPRQANFMGLESELAAGSVQLGARPVELALELTTECPMNCIHCFRTYEAAEDAKAVGHMDPALVERLAPFFDTALRILIVGDGEPLSHPQFETIMKTCLASGAEISFSTNGAGLDDGLSRTLAEGGLRHIQFSVDGATEETYAAIRRGSRLKSALHGLANMVRSREQAGREGPLISVASVMMKRNVEEMAGLVRIAAEAGADQVVLNPLHIPETNPHLREFYRRESPALDRAAGAVAEARAVGETLGIAVHSPVVDGFLARGEEGVQAWNRQRAPVPTHAVVPEYADLLVSPSAITETVSTETASMGTDSTETASMGTDSTDTVSLGTDARQSAAEDCESGESMPGAEKIPSTPPPPPAVVAPPAKEPFLCTQPWTTLFVHWDGQVSPCFLNPAGLARLTPLSDPDEIWNGKAFRDARRRLRAGDRPGYCLPCQARPCGMDQMEEYSRVVFPVLSSTDPNPEYDWEPEMEPDAITLGLGFSRAGTSLALGGKGLSPTYRRMDAVTGLQPCRVISRLSPAAEGGELFAEEPVFMDLVQKVLAEGGLPGPDEVEQVVYSARGTMSSCLPGEKNPVIENLFPHARVFSVEPDHSRMACAFFTSPFKTACLLMVEDPDQGSGEEAPAVVIGKGEKNSVTRLACTAPPHNPAGLYRAGMQYAGLDDSQGDAFAALAAQGSEKLVKEFLKGIQPLESVQILEELFGPACVPGEAPASRHQDAARAVEKAMGHVLALCAVKAHEATGCTDLCLAGEVEFSPAVQQAILDGSPVNRLHVSPGGSAALALGHLLHATVVAPQKSPPRAQALIAALAQEGAASPTGEEREKYGQATWLCLKERLDRLAWLLRDQGQGAMPLNGLSALSGLVRRNERLLAQSGSLHQELAKLKKLLAGTTAYKILALAKEHFKKKKKAAH